MNTYLLSVGWWNLIGCIFMLGFFDERVGKKVLNEWTKIFSVQYTAGYWNKLWLAWLIGLNVFFAIINISAARWPLQQLKTACVIFDLIAYILFFILAIWGVQAKRTGKGIYSVFIIFGIWIIWGAIIMMAI